MKEGVLALCTIFFLSLLIPLFVFSKVKVEVTPKKENTIIFIISFLISTLIFYFLLIKKTAIIKIWYYLGEAVALIYFFSFIFGDYSIFVVALLFLIKNKLNLLRNITEIFAYEGIALMLSQTLSLTSFLIILAILSIYDLISVKKGIMTKMAKRALNQKIFPGIIVKNVALGGGDITFSLTYLYLLLLRKLYFAYFVSLSVLSISFTLFLYFMFKKGKAYPALPLIFASAIISLACLYI